MAELALDLDHRAIGLLRREPSAPGGWERVAEAPLDAPDLDARLHALRGAAEAMIEGPVVADLLIPASQISIVDLDLGCDLGETAADWHALGAEARHALVANALERLAGGEGDVFAFDWRQDGPELRVAVVAAGTLREAEEFARSYGFGPARLTAWPDPGTGFAVAAAFCDAGDEAPPVEAVVARPARPAPQAALPSERASEPPARGKGAAADEAEAMTVFGARSGQAGARRGRRRPRGLLIAGGLAAALALASAAVLTLRPGGGEVIEAGAVEPPAEVASAPSASPAPEPRPFAAEPVVVPVPPAGAPPPPAAPEEDARRAAAPAPDPAPAGPSEADRARAAYAATGIWLSPPAAPGAPQPQTVGAPEATGPVEVAALAAPASLSPPSGAAPDAPPPAMAPLPPPGAEFELSADGRVEATPEGAPTPDGITVFAAPPPRRPPGRPAETVLPPGEAFQDPALADARPRPRPDDAPPVAVAGNGAGPADAEEEAPAAGALAEAAIAEALLDGAAPAVARERRCHPC